MIPRTKKVLVTDVEEMNEKSCTSVRSLISEKKYKDQLAYQHTHKSPKNEDNKAQSVLLIIENEDGSKTIETYLHGQPYKVMIEKSAKKAVEICNQRKIDLIIYDVRNEEDGGLEACGRLKEKEETANIQILIISDPSYLEENYDLFEIWNDDFLLTPIGANDLKIRVDALLKKKSYLDTLPVESEDSVRAAIIDTQSGLSNYFYFKYFLGHELKRYARDQRPVSLVIMEIFDDSRPENSSKEPFNNRNIGELGTIFKRNIRNIDLAARLIEMKFALVLPDTDNNGAKTVAKRLYKLVNNYLNNSDQKSSAAWAIKYGIAVYPSDADSTELLIEHAEKVLRFSVLDSN